MDLHFARYPLGKKELTEGKPERKKLRRHDHHG